MSRLMKMTTRLTPVQRAVLLTRLQMCDERERAVAVVQQRQAHKPACPGCSATLVVRNGQADGLQRYKCRACSVSFNALTGTPLARLRYRERWLAQCAALQDGLSVRKAAAQLDVHRTTAFRWRHRFLQCPATIKDLAMRGVVEADETYVLESFKGQRVALAGAGRPSRRRGGKARKRGLSREQIPILVLRARTGQTADFVLPAAADKAAVQTVMACAVADDAVLCTDGSGLLASVAQALDIEHQPVNASKGQRVRGAWHVQNVNAYQSRLKQWLRRFNGVATSYLANYLGWFRALDRQGSSVRQPASMLALAVNV
jgi:transposase-like protein